MFELMLRANPDIPEPTKEHRFHQVRKWRFDYAWITPSHRVAVEIDGGQWVAGGGRHNRDSDREKLNHAAADGWRVLRFSTQQIEREPDACIELLRRALQWHS
jgi:very-short-patch-repair endonuclease